ncbi:hypothetical protein KC19_7G158900 [Ceratodon purpureus]|uniref:Uncharacterized protein n=1 Tax=Ceratodon purpureus TaxID=3225 RepID=A0A8T0HAR3_CERPU|nr:hypothetical protein KC19_7G158900 [Ceratodon purpureus]
MVRNRRIDPEDYVPIDIEATMREMRERSAELEATAREERHRHKRQRRNRAQVPFGLRHNFRLACPCTRCARDDRMHVRLYSTVLVHINKYLMADKYQFEYRHGLRNAGVHAGLRHVEVGSTSRDPELQTDAEVQDSQEDALPPQEPPAQLQAHQQGLDINLERGSNPNSTYKEQQVSIPIYTGSNCSKLDFTNEMLSWQVRHKITDIAMDELFKLVRDIVPQGRNAKGNLIENNIPVNRAEARSEVIFAELRKLLREIGVDEARKVLREMRENH